MRCLELFSGSSDLSNFFRSRGALCVDVDWDAKTPALIHADILKLSLSDLKGLFSSGSFDFIWASPDCTTYSYAARGIHRFGASGGYAPKTDYARFCDRVNLHLWNDILLPSGVPFVVENPRCMYRHKPWVSGSSLVPVQYGDYGAPSLKPEDLFTNCPSLFDFVQSPRLRKCSRQLDWCANGCLGRSKMPSVFICDIWHFACFEVSCRSF